MALEVVSRKGNKTEARSFRVGQGPADFAEPCVLLRPLTSNDLTALQFLHTRTPSQEAEPTGAIWLAGLERRPDRSGGGWGVIDVKEARLCGLVIYQAVRAKADAAILSYGLEVHSRGRGLGSAAVRCAAAKLMTEMAFVTLFADVELSNTASKRLLYKVGFEPSTLGVTPGVDIAPGISGQRWWLGLPQFTNGRSVIDLGPNRVR